MNRGVKPKSNQLRVGRLTKAHGLKGALKVELYTDDPAHRFTPGAVFTLQVPTGSKWHGKTIELAELRWYNGHAVAFLKGVEDRNEAETLVKAILWIDADEAPDNDEPDAWYDHQLAGLRVMRDGVEVGTIARIEHMPAQDLLIVKAASGEVMVPFVSAIVPEVNVEQGFIVVTPPMGLFEDLAEIAAEEASAEEAPAEVAADDESAAEVSVDDASEQPVSGEEAVAETSKDDASDGSESPVTPAE
ncbi:16S rRNA processing protein RimM [Mycetocola sp. BIGb0189]|uniref:ribosome maturation factor RimM n=1 Tax=Mycetocola sp. BIGb0189 TaxID=2940604 RepID=UPI002167E23B|nr:ribosome maturation factor RimM [Mycetocola sp. BIGb0189]MCS4275752.1 16S rRNA processing protein RimM [Mycetocola sp. BIGb0189]